MFPPIKHLISVVSLHSQPPERWTLRDIEQQLLQANRQGNFISTCLHYMSCDRYTLLHCPRSNYSWLSVRVIWVTWVTWVMWDIWESSESHVSSESCQSCESHQSHVRVTSESSLELWESSESHVRHNCHIVYMCIVCLIPHSYNIESHDCFSFMYACRTD